MILRLNIRYTSVDGKSKFVSRIPRMYAIFMGYWMAIQVRTTSGILMCKNKSRMGDMTLRRILMTPCDILWRNHLKRIRNIALLVSSRGIFYGHGAAL